MICILDKGHVHNWVYSSVGVFACNAKKTSLLMLTLLSHATSHASSHTSSHASAYTIPLANIAPVASSTTAEVPVTILLLIDLFSLLLGMPLGLLPVYVVESFGLNQLVHLRLQGPSVRKLESIKMQVL